MKNIRKAFIRGLWLTAITGALAVASMACRRAPHTPTPWTGTRSLSASPAVTGPRIPATASMAGCNSNRPPGPPTAAWDHRRPRRGKSRYGWLSGSWPPRGSVPGRHAAQTAVAAQPCGARPVWPLDAMCCASAVCSASSTCASCAPRCSARWRRSAFHAEARLAGGRRPALMLRRLPHALRRSARIIPCQRLGTCVRRRRGRTSRSAAPSRPTRTASAGCRRVPLPMSAPTSGAQRRLSEPRHRLRIGRLDDQSAGCSRPLHVRAGRKQERRPRRHRRQMPGQHRLGHQDRRPGGGGAQERRSQTDDPAEQCRFADDARTRRRRKAENRANAVSRSSARSAKLARIAASSSP